MMETRKRISREQRNREHPRRRELLPRERESELGPCQVRIKTDTPCPYSAVLKIRGVPFCEWCAREQAAYFAIGDLTQVQRMEAVRGQPGFCCLASELLVEMSDRARWKLVGRIIKAVKREGRPFGSLAAE